MKPPGKPSAVAIMPLPVYVINMDRSRCRWEHASGQLDHMNIPHTRIAAVDGSELDESELKVHTGNRKILYRWIRDVAPAEVGCCLSHKKIWDQIAHGDSQGGFVFEDDFVADANLPAIVDAIGNLQLDYPVLIKLYFPEPSIHLSGYYRSDDVMSAPLVGEHRLVLPMYTQWGTVAYYINRSGAAQLVKSIKHIHRPIDDILRRTWETGVMVLHVVPSPVRHSDAHSIIAPSRREMQLSKASRWYDLAFTVEFVAMSRAVMIARYIRIRRMFSGIKK